MWAGAAVFAAWLAGEGTRREGSLGTPLSYARKESSSDKRVGQGNHILTVFAGL